MKARSSCQKIVLTVLVLMLAVLCFVSCDSGEDETVTITFVANDLIVGTYTIEKKGDLTEIPAVPPVSGYTGSWNVGSFTGITSDMTVTAEYKKNTYIASFYVDNKLFDRRTVTVGVELADVPAVPVKEGYSGVWSLTDFTKKIADTRVDAIYTPKQMKVVFKYTDDEEKNHSIVKEVPYGGTLSDVPAVPGRVGLFGNWDVTDFTSITANKTVNAVYTPARLKVSLDGAAEGTPAEITVDFRDRLTLPAVQTKEGYAFNGWYLDNNYLISAESDGKTAEITQDVTYYAQWIKDNAAEATASDLWTFTLLDNGTYALGASANTFSGELVLPSVHEGKPVTRLADGLFKNNTAISKVTLPEGLTDVGNEAFSGCTHLANVIFPVSNKIAVVGDDAFKGTVLTTVSFGSHLVTIGDGAFDSVSSLIYINIVDGALETIGDRAFYGCSKVGSLTLPATLKSVGDYAFYSMKNCIFTFEGYGNLEKVGEYAFKSCERLTAFEGATVDTLGRGAFAGCVLLRRLIVTGNNPMVYYFDSDDYAESYAVSQQIRKTDENGYIKNADGSYQYEEMPMTSNLPNALYYVGVRSGTKEIVEYFLNDCYTVKDIFIPASVEFIGRYAYSVTDTDLYAISPTSGTLVFESGSVLKEIGDYAFHRRTAVNGVTFPDSLVTIGDYAFYYATKLSSVVLTEKVSSLDGAEVALTSVGRSAFVGTEWLTLQEAGVVYLGTVAVGLNKPETLPEQQLKLTFRPDTTAIAPYAFYQTYEKLTTVTVCPSVKVIGAYAFGSCTRLTSAAIQCAEVIIGDGAFADCSALLSASLPSDVSYGKSIFSGCNALKFLTYSGETVAGDLFGTEQNGETDTEIYAAMQTEKNDVDFTVEQPETGDVYALSWNYKYNKYGSVPETVLISVKGAVNADGTAAEDFLLAEMERSGGYDGAYDASENGFSVAVTLTSEENKLFVQTAYGNFYLPLSASAAESASSLKDFISVSYRYLTTYYLPVSMEKVTFLGDTERIADYCLYGASHVKEIVIGDATVEIGAYAFADCTMLGTGSKAVVLPASVQKIGEGAFKATSSMTIMNLSDSGASALGEIGSYAFAQSAVHSFSAPESLGTIGDSAFRDGKISILDFSNGETLTIGDSAFRNTKITAVAFPDTLVSLGEYAFADSVYLSRVDFNEAAQLDSIGQGAFSFCELLAYVSVPHLTKGTAPTLFAGSSSVSQLTVFADEYNSAGGAAGFFEKSSVFDADKEYLVSFDGEKYVVPMSLSTVTVVGKKIADGMFGGFTSVKTADLGDVVNIGKAAFAGCTSLSAVSLGTGLLTIGESAFADCVSVTDYRIPAGCDLLNAAKNAFIGENAFAGNALLTTFDFSGCQSIAAGVMRNCTALKSVKLGSASSIGDFAFENCTALAAVELPSVINEIGAYAFFNCRDAKFSYVEMNALTRVGEMAFFGCKGLKNFVAENIESVGSSAFGCVSQMEKLTLPANATLGMLFGSSFYDGSYDVEQGGTYFLPLTLRSVTVSKKAQFVNAKAFGGCTSLSDVTFLTDEPPIIGADAAEGCSPDLHVFVPFGAYEKYLRVYSELASAMIPYPADLTKFVFTPYGEGYSVAAASGASLGSALCLPSLYEGKPVTRIAAGGFAENNDIEELVMPSAVETIGAGAFFGCENLTSVQFAVDSALSVIEANAFNESGLLSVAIPDSVITIGVNAFMGKRTYIGSEYVYTGALTSVTFGEESRLTAVESGAFAYNSDLLAINLPDSLGRIGDGAFAGSGLTSVSFKKVTEIGARAFMDCTALVDVYLGTEVITVGDKAFENCLLVDTVILNKAKEIGARAFYGCTGLKNLTLGTDVVTIGEYSFAFCTTLARLALSSTTKYVGDYAFFGCTGLSVITTEGAGVEYIGESAFDGTAWSENVNTSQNVVRIGDIIYAVKGTVTGELTIDEGVTTIAPNTFKNQTELTSVSLPSSLKFIGASAFEGCTLLTQVNFCGHDLTAIYDRVFYGSGLTSLTLPQGLESIGNEAFRATSLLSVALPDTLRSVGNSAFRDIPMTGELVLPDDMDFVGEYAFYNFGGTVSVENLSKAGSKAFGGATLNKMPAGLSVVNDAFANVEFVDDAVTIGETVTKIEEGAFIGSDVSRFYIYATNLREIGAQAFYMQGAEFYFYYLNALHTVGSEAFSGCDSLTSFLAPNIVTVGANAFDGCTALESVTLPGSDVREYFGETVIAVKNLRIATGTVSVEDNAFYGVTSVESVYFPETVTAVGRNAFAGNTALRTLSFAFVENLAEVGANAFDGTAWLTARPAGVVYLGKVVYGYVESASDRVTLTSGTLYIADDAFMGTNIKSVVIPYSVRVIGDNAFASCRSLQTVSIAGNSVLTELGSNAFGGCTSLASIELPSQLATVGNSVLGNCENLVSISYSPVVTLKSLFGNVRFDGSYLNDGHFMPSSLATVRCVSGGKTICDYAFDGASSLTSVYIASSVETVGSYAFRGCEMLQNLSILPGSRLTSVGTGAFADCISLSSASFTASVSLENAVFEGCNALTEVTVGGSATKANLFANVPALFKTLKIADGSTSIAANAFKNLSGVTGVVLPASVETLGAESFSGMPALESVQIQDASRLSEVGDKAFFGCDKLTSVALGAYVKSIGREAFKNCTLLSSLSVNTDNCYVADEAFANTAWFNAQSNMIIVGKTLVSYKGSDNVVVIPDTVTVIAAKAFADADLINKISIPSCVTEIGDYAFSGCESLMQIEFLDAASSALKKIPVGAFKDCAQLANVNLPDSVEVIGDDAFYGDNAFVYSLTLPAALKEIGDRAFYNAQIEQFTVLTDNAIEKIGADAFASADPSESAFVLPELSSLISLGDNAFKNRTTLTSFIAPHVKTVGASVFEGCTTLSSVTLRDSFSEIASVIPATLETVYLSTALKEIPDGTFRNSNVKRVYLTDNVTIIGEEAFAGSKLEYIYNINNVESIGARAFASCAFLIGTDGSSTFTLFDKVTTIMDEAFSECTAVTGFRLAVCSRLLSIGQKAFANMKNAAFDLPTLAWLRTVGKEAFVNCYGLTGFAAPNIVTVGQGAFAYAKGLSRVTLPGEVPIYTAFYTEDYTPDSTEGLYNTYVPVALTEVSISAVSVELAADAFADMTKVETVDLKNVRTIGDNAFRGTSITEVAIPASVMSIGKNAFDGLTELAQVAFQREDVISYVGKDCFNGTAWYDGLFDAAEDGVIYIGRVAYSAKGTLPAQLTLREGTTAVTKGAFSDRTELTDITLPATLVFYDTVLDGCYNLASIKYNGLVCVGTLFGSELFTNAYTVSQSGVTYYVPASLTKVEFSAESLRIADDALRGCYNLTSAVIPTEAKGIGADVLRGCYKLEELSVNGTALIGRLFGSVSYNQSSAVVQEGETWYVPDSLLRVKVLGEETCDYFAQNMTGLISVDVASVLSFGRYSLANCSGLTSIEFGAATRLKEYALAGCIKLTDIALPDTAIVDANVLAGDYRLTEITVSGDVVVPSLFGTESYTAGYDIVMNGFTYYLPQSLISVNLTSVTHVAEYSLYGMKNVINVTLPSETESIGDYAFYGMSSVLTFTLPGSVRSIGKYAFYGDKTAIFAFVDNAIETVEEYAFGGCEALTDFNSDAIRVIGEAAFNGCQTMRTVTVFEDIDVLAAFGTVSYVNSIEVESEGKKYYVPGTLVTITVISEGGESTDYDVSEYTE